MSTNNNAGRSREIYSETIESDAYEASKEVNRILEIIRLNFKIDKEQCFDVKVILSELLQNAIKHGNDYDNKKKISINVWIENNSIGITVKDQGGGFDYRSIRNLKLNKLSDCDPMTIDETGRGLFIVQNLCDCMEFNPSGNMITVMKKLS
ncbi:MAG: ATP-binding protein [Clostridiaceae bacterium]|nr:ATP-binding protein [Clostridiaceae bacterium]